MMVKCRDYLYNGEFKIIRGKNNNDSMIKIILILKTSLLN
jgi:hypothetical protein